MKNYLKFISLLSLVCFFGLKAAQAQTTENYNPYTQLTVEVSTPKQEYLSLEPIPFVFKVSNQTDKPILGETSVDFADNVSVSLKYEGKGIPLKSRLSNAIKCGRQQFIIQPGEVKENNLLLLDNLDKIFSNYGEYELRFFVYRGRPDGKTDEIYADPLKITILEPEGINKEAYNFIVKTKAQTASDTPYETRLKNDLEFIEKYGDTPYAMYTIYFVAGSLYSQGKLEKAEELYNKIKDREDFIYHQRVVSDLTQINFKLRPIPTVPDKDDDN